MQGVVHERREPGENRSGSGGRRSMSSPIILRIVGVVGVTSRSTVSNGSANRRRIIFCHVLPASTRSEVVARQSCDSLAAPLRHRASHAPGTRRCTSLTSAGDGVDQLASGDCAGHLDRTTCAPSPRADRSSPRIRPPPARPSGLRPATAEGPRDGGREGPARHLIVTGHDPVADVDVARSSRPAGRRCRRSGQEGRRHRAGCVHG